MGLGGSTEAGGDEVRAIVGTLSVAVLTGGLLVSGAGAAAADGLPGPVLAYSGVGETGTQGLYAVDTGTHRQWLVADGWVQDPQWSPTGTRIAWIAYGTDDLGHVQVADADGTDRRQVDGDGDSRALAWSPDGTLGWFHRSAWMPTDCFSDDRFVRPDLVLQAEDGSSRVLGSVAPTATDLTFSPDGTLAVWRESGADVCGVAPTVLVVADVATGAQTVVAGSEDTTGAEFSPDSATIALNRSTPDGGDVVLVDVASRTAVQVVTPDEGEEFATFVDGGNSLAVVRTAAQGRQVALVGRDGVWRRDLAEAPEYVETLMTSTDRTSVLVAGRALPSADGAFPDVSVWRQPLDGSAATEVTANGVPATFEATLTAWPSNAPVVERHTRGRR
jgi:Tol biopolymer transport system component